MCAGAKNDQIVILLIREKNGAPRARNRQGEDQKRRDRDDGAGRDENRPFAPTERQKRDGKQRKEGDRPEKRKGGGRKGQGREGELSGPPWKEILCVGGSSWLKQKNKRGAQKV